MVMNTVSGLLWSGLAVQPGLCPNNTTRISEDTSDADADAGCE
jgi:hypothetical protein